MAKINDDASWSQGSNQGSQDAYRTAASDATAVIFDAPAAVDGRAICCLICGLTSYHPDDVKYRYCGNCKLFHAEVLIESARGN